MTWLTLCLPFFLAIHNTVDFRDFGARENYATFLNYTVTEYVEMIEKNNPSLRLVNHSGHMDCKIHHITLNFESDQTNTIDSARDLVLGILATFLDAINHGCCGRLPPFLCPCPFTTDNVDIEIHFVGECLYNYPAPNSIQYVTFSGGKIGYFIQDPGLCGGVHQIRTEPLDFARQLAHPPKMINCPSYALRCEPQTYREWSYYNFPPPPPPPIPLPPPPPPVVIAPAPIPQVVPFGPHPDRLLGPPAPLPGPRPQLQAP